MYESCNMSVISISRPFANRFMAITCGSLIVDTLRARNKLVFVIKRTSHMSRVHKIAIKMNVSCWHRVFMLMGPPVQANATMQPAHTHTHTQRWTRKEIQFYWCNVGVAMMHAPARIECYRRHDQCDVVQFVNRTCASITEDIST